MNGSADKTIPILAGGVFIGVLAAIPLINCGCCLWGIAGGMLTTFLFMRNYTGGPIPPGPADGALLGALAGLCGAVIDTLISIPLHSIMSGVSSAQMDAVMEQVMADPNIPPAAKAFLQSLASGGLGFSAILLGFLISMVVFAVLGALGGMLGAAVFKGQVPVPPVPPSHVEPTPPPVQTQPLPSPHEAFQSPARPEEEKPEGEEGGPEKSSSDE